MSIRVLILACIIAGILAAAAHASPVPDEAESDCSWSEHGTTMIVGDTEYRCLCAQLTTQGRKVIACRWYDVAVLPKAAKKRIPAKKRKAILIHAALPGIVG